MKKEELVDRFLGQEVNQERRKFLIALGIIGVGVLTGCTGAKEIIALEPSPTPVRPTPTDIPPRPTLTLGPTPTSVTETPVPEKEIEREEIVVGETGKRNPIVAEYLTQDKKPEGIVIIFGGTHPGENTGWKEDDKTKEGYLTIVKEWLLTNKQDWSKLAVGLVDVNPDGKGRETPRRIDLGRNFGGEECPVCSWSKTDWRTRKVTDPSGDSPMSEPEAKAQLNLVRIFKEKGNILFAVFLHGEIPPKGLLDPGYCGETGNPLSCQISREIARLTGADYSEVFPPKYYGNPSYPSGIAGLATDYFSTVLNIPSASFEFPEKKPSEKNAAVFCRALFEAVKLNYSISE